MDNAKPLIAAAVAGAVTSYFRLDLYIPLPVPIMFLESLAGVAAYTLTDTLSDTKRGAFLPYGQAFALFAGMAGGFAVEVIVR
jgi:hypothetical protein